MSMSHSRDPELSRAVLVSGGLDSAVLLAESLPSCSAVFPLYIRAGLRWEQVELEHLQRFLRAIAQPALQSLTVLEQPVADLYGSHWSLTGREVPDQDSSDEAVYLPGRNVLLLSKAMLWCHLHDVPELALAPLRANPFPDATPAFFTAFQNAVNQALQGQVQVLWPYLELSKTEVLLRGRKLPLEHTFSCLQPVGGRHCGECNKCTERQRAFLEAEVNDPTDYSRKVSCSG
ncbi:MAG TPA: 7-cyano-7-deazaguanine synthase [Gemmataceae bacterium]|jgi:7-cyano-7-deazaguanine synthase|nr:7-cyano-7-deazaguanine synthase [Gemmataceae bacterium]